MFLWGQMTDWIPRAIALYGDVKQTTNEGKSGPVETRLTGLADTYGSEALKSWVKACEQSNWKQILFSLGVRSDTAFECWSHVHTLVMLDLGIRVIQFWVSHSHMHAAVSAQVQHFMLFFFYLCFIPQLLLERRSECHVQRGLGMKLSWVWASYMNNDSNQGFLWLSATP